MKWLLVNKFDEIVDTCEIASGVGVSGAKTYFMGVKQIDEENFDKLWKVMCSERYDSCLPHYKIDNINGGKRKSTKPDEGFDY